MLIAKGISKAYDKLKVINDISLNVEKGEIVSIIGASGAGKSTLLQILGTLDNADSGRVEINGQAVSGLIGKSLANFRNKHLGFVFQFHNLLPEFTAAENVMMPLLIAGTTLKVASKKAEEMLQLLGLAERVHHKPSELSGGEQQRVAVARALINNPMIVFADEPSGNLDSKNSQDLHKLFFKIRDELNQTFLIVTHNPDLANMSDRILEIKDGNIVKVK
ncbi:ABC transporter ATP-binding protein [Fulvivirgaceae bacterium LMO-SS25]